MLLITPQAQTHETELASHVRKLSIEMWGEKRQTMLIGGHDSMVRAQEKIARFAQAEAPVLITGETGTGKELFARAIFLLGGRRRKPFISVNCAQYTDGQLIASELFGHRRGSFTGALNDHKGVFEEANTGVVFLDEVGELSLGTQAMLLRVLSEGEIVPVGETRARHVDVRVIAATNRDLRAMVAAGTFREDLYFRLSFLNLRIPPLRDRGSDWRLMVDHYLRRLNGVHHGEKRFSESSMESLCGYRWPGNVRELRGLVECSYHMNDGGRWIEPDAFADNLRGHEGDGPDSSAPSELRQAHEIVARMAATGETFWTLAYEPFMDREMCRRELKAIIEVGLQSCNWSYKRILKVFGVPDEEYLKFMDFLRHHRLKPER